MDSKHKHKHNNGTKKRDLAFAGTRLFIFGLLALSHCLVLHIQHKRGWIPLIIKIHKVHTECYSNYLAKMVLPVQTTTAWALYNPFYAFSAVLEYRPTWINIVNTIETHIPAITGSTRE